MDIADSKTESLFSYGTLQQEDVQRSTFNRLLEGAPDSLIGYVVTLIPIRDQNVVAAKGETHYRNLQFTGLQSDEVAGTVFKVTTRELEQADEYELPAEYERVPVLLKSGIAGWVYLHEPRNSFP
jgi:hypothetical protein